MTPSPTKPLPCPFCGEAAETDHMQGFRCITDGAMSNASSIYCVKCAANLTLCHEDLPEFTPEQLVEMVTKIWNTRSRSVREEELEKAVAVTLGSSWVEGIPPIKRIVLMWNGKGLFGPIAFQSEENRDDNLQRIICADDGRISGPVTHYLFVPEAPRPALAKLEEGR